MKYDNISCPVCEKLFDDDFEVVVCPECGTPHHRNCFNDIGHCVNKDKHSEGFSWAKPYLEPIIDVKAEVAKEDAKNNIDLNDINSDNSDITCPRCGDSCSSDTKICPNCGQRLTTLDNEFMPDPSFKMTNSSDMSKQYTISPEDTIDNISVREMGVFLRLGSLRYLEKFYKMEKLGQKFSWSWSAFLSTLIFGPYWFIKKKMYVAATVFGAIYLAIHAVFQPLEIAIAKILEPYMVSFNAAIETYGYTSTEASNIASACISEVPRSYLLTFMVCVSAFLLLAIVAGIIGTRLYKNHTKKTILSIREKTDDIQKYYMLLEQKGKNDFLFAFIIWILLYLITHEIFPRILPVLPFLK